jgi:radical SAM protein with 4Fe4S-binding SPASM domain
MPLDLFKHIISQLSPAYQIESVGSSPRLCLFHYGDLCLYPYIYESINFVKQQGFYSVSSSMASLFTRERALEAIKAGLDEIWLMVDGIDEETSKKIRGKAASFEKAIENINYLIELKKTRRITHPVIYIFMIRQPANIHQWSAFEKFFKGMYPDVHSRIVYFSNFGGNVPEINIMLKKLREMNSQPEEDKRVEKLNNYRCYYPWHSVSILSDGRVVPCCRDMNGDYVLGNLNEKSLQDIWNGTPIQNLRREWIDKKVRNSLCLPCTEANNEIGLPHKSFPLFYVIDRLFPNRFCNSKIDSKKTDQRH